jgi:ferritin-like protein
VDTSNLPLSHVELTRRALLKTALGAVAFAAIPFGILDGTPIDALAADLPDDIAILNFALTLEHLEARAYREAIASGKLTGKNLAYAQAYGAQEAEHVTLLTRAISQAGKTPVSEQATYNFPAFTDEKAVVGFLRLLEDTGVGAYNGAARYITDKGILAVAGGIVQVEARHAAILRRQAGLPPVPSAVEKILTPDQTLAAAGPILG